MKGIKRINPKMQDNKLWNDQIIDNRFPVPEVGRERQFFADVSISIAESAQNVDDGELALKLYEKSDNKDPKGVKELEKEKSKSYSHFYSEAKGVLRALRPHIAPEDKAHFDIIWKKLIDRTNPAAYDVESVDELSEFIIQALKNANLSEMGRKSRLNEIIGEIDISRF
jgi:hypothetical protein